MIRLLWLTLLVGSFLCCDEVFAAGDVSIRWFGHSCFLITSSQGTKLLTDPVGEETGYKLPDVMPDIITISHEHFDHNYIRPYMDNDPVVFRGEDSHGRDWQKTEAKVKDIDIYSVGTYHDNSQGKKDGKNSAFVFLVDGLRIVHLGDLGHLLTEEQIKAIGTPDVLFIPTGGNYTIEFIQAAEVIKQLQPKIVMPMHFKTPACNFTLFSVKRFLKEMKNVRVLLETSIVVNKDTLPGETEVVSLRYE